MRLKKEKEKSTQKQTKEEEKNQKFALYDDSRAIIRPIRSLVHLARDRGKSKKVTRVWKGREWKLTLPTDFSTRTPDTRRNENPLSDRLFHVDLQNTTDGGLAGNLTTHTY